MWLSGSAGANMQTQFTHPGYALCAVLLASAAAGSVLAGGASSPGRGKGWEEVADRARTKVVVLKTAREGAYGAATGFLARPRLVITAGHAVTQGRAITAWVNGVGYHADVQAIHPDHDLAVLRLRAPELLLKPLELARSAEGLVEDEELVILAGPSQPAGAKGDPSARLPIHATFQRRVALRDASGRVNNLLALRGSVRRGDSGAPVIRVRDGSVVGVLSSRALPDAQGVSQTAYAVPVDAIQPWLDASPTSRAGRDEDFYLFRLKK